MSRLFHDVTSRRFEFPLDGENVAYISYRDAGDRLILDHTAVPVAFAGQGIATSLALDVFEFLRSQNLKAELACSFLVKFGRLHPEYQDVVAG